MESYILITTLNDFIFCPRSIYFHNLYNGYSTKNYHRVDQTRGKIAHQSIDEQRYSTQKKYLVGLEVFCEKYNLMGKIDVYDSKDKILIERKRTITTIYDGYRYQLYAQYFCLKEMGYEVKRLFFHSLTDNKRYELAIPENEALHEFEKLIENIRLFDMATPFTANKNKCDHCVYSQLCDLSLAEGPC